MFCMICTRRCHKLYNNVAIFVGAAVNSSQQTCGRPVVCKLVARDGLIVHKALYYQLP